MAKWIEEIEICTFIYILYAVAAQLDDMGIMPNSEENSFLTFLPVKELLPGALDHKSQIKTLTCPISIIGSTITRTKQIHRVDKVTCPVNQSSAQA